MDYTIFKANEPTETVEKIKKILSEVDIQVEEKILKHEKEKEGAPSSLTLFLRGCKEYKSEGKGASLINAKASAYAEFIERLQNDFIFPLRTDDFVFSPDESFLEKDSFSDVRGINERIFFLLSDFVNKNRKNLSLKYKNSVLTVPFYGVEEKKVTAIPILVYEWLAGSNGMAAGNTIEEALVQAFSEICERYVMKRVICEKISLPNIPSEEYLKYSKISKILNVYNENGYKVEIKDASLGKELPVVCTIITNTKENIVTFGFASHPSLPVAIERCLTEYSQGFDITSSKNQSEKLFLQVKNSNSESKNLKEIQVSSATVSDVSNDSNLYNEQYIEKEVFEYLVNTNNLKFLAEKQFIHRVDIENCTLLKEIFIDNSPKYSYSNQSWISNSVNVDNKFLLKFIVNKIKNITSEIYVRDVSFLGFPAVRILIPQMSFIFDYDVERIETTKKWIDWLKLEYTSERDSIQGLYSALDTKLDLGFHLDSQFSDLPIEYILFLCAIYLNDVDKVLILANKIIENNDRCKFFKDEFITRVHIIKKFYELKLKNVEFAEILNQISLLYDDEDVKKFKIFMRYLSSHVIKILIKPHNSKRSNQIGYVKNQKQVDEIITNLVKKHKDNIINQSNLANVFKDV